MFKELPISAFLEHRNTRVVIDVRAPREFAMGHIAGAVNIPLFDDTERAQVGISYKHEGRQAAIRKGLAITGPKLDQFIAQVEALSTDRSLAVHCWRGGMRSKSMATLFDFAGFDTVVLKGGYKAYRARVHDILSQPLQLAILGGRTGSGKTLMLEGLAAAGEQVIDLEKLAHHKGSAFGDLGEMAQPSTEMFENLLFEQLAGMNLEKRIWVEDESHLIGTVFIPESFWKGMRSAPVFFCDVPLEERVRYLVDTYGHFDAEGITRAVEKITRRLGGQHAKAALAHFEAGELAEATRIVLVYYDKTYAYGLSQRDQQQIHTLEIPTIDKHVHAAALISLANTTQHKTYSDSIQQ